MPEELQEIVLDRLEEMYDYYDARHDDLMESFYKSENQTQKSILLSQRNYVAGCLEGLECAMNIILGVID